jgi:hypothetical protein
MYELEKLLVMLLTEGSVSEAARSWKISFKNKSNIFVKLFVNYFKKLYGTSPRIIRTKDGTYLAYIYSTEIAKKLLSSVDSFRTKACTEKPLCTLYLKQKEEHLKECVIFDGKPYHKIVLPKTLFNLPLKERREIVKILVSAEGHIVFSKISGRRPNEIVRKILITCFHPLLREQFKKLIESCGIKCSLEGRNRIRISGKDNLIKFRKEIGFLPEIKVSKGKVWKGISKQRLLSLLINSYSSMRGIHGKG